VARAIAIKSEAREGRETINGARLALGAFVERGSAALAQTGNHQPRQVAKAGERVLPQERWGSQGHPGDQRRGQPCQQTFHQKTAAALTGAMGRMESAGTARSAEAGPQHSGGAGAWVMEGVGQQGGAHRWVTRWVHYGAVGQLHQRPLTGVADAGSGAGIGWARGFAVWGSRVTVPARHPPKRTSNLPPTPSSAVGPQPRRSSGKSAVPRSFTLLYAVMSKAAQFWAAGMVPPKDRPRVWEPRHFSP